MDLIIIKLSFIIKQPAEEFKTQFPYLGENTQNYKII